MTGENRIVYRPAPMSKLVSQLVIWGLLASVTAWGDDYSLGPRPGVLVLRNGRVMQGQITQAGDFYLIALDDTGEVRLPATQVEFSCATLDEAYLRKRDALIVRDVKSHLELADWCLRNGLTARAGDQVLAAWTADPSDANLRAFERRLQVLAESQRATVSPRNPTLERTRSRDETESGEAAVLDLPLGAIEVYTSVIQPLLMNRCGAAHCHGPTSASKYHLVRPSQGNMVTRRLTERNLYATLAQIDRQSPDHSPLLTQPLRAHGGNKSPVFGEREWGQYQQLVAWVRQIAAGQSMLPDRVSRRESPPVPREEPVANQPAASPAERDGSLEETPFTPRPKTGKPRRVEKPVADPRPTRLPDANAPASDPNPFDPEVFNRRYFPAEQAPR